MGFDWFSRFSAKEDEVRRLHEKLPLIHTALLGTLVVLAVFAFIVVHAVAAPVPVQLGVLYIGTVLPGLVVHAVYKGYRDYGELWFDWRMLVPFHPDRELFQRGNPLRIGWTGVVLLMVFVIGFGYYGYWYLVTAVLLYAFSYATGRAMKRRGRQFWETGPGGLLGRLLLVLFRRQVQRLERHQEIAEIESWPALAHKLYEGTPLTTEEMARVDRQIRRTAELVREIAADRVDEKHAVTQEHILNTLRAEQESLREALAGLPSIRQLRARLDQDDSLHHDLAEQRAQIEKAIAEQASQDSVKREQPKTPPPDSTPPTPRAS